MMKRFLSSLVATLAVAGVAHADTFSFAADASTYSCGTYCTGFVTTDPNHTVTYVNVSPANVYGTAYWLNMTVDGVNYRGQVTGQNVPAQLTEQDIVNGIAVYGTQTIIASAQWTVRTTRVNSGRAHYTITRLWAYSGNVATP